MILFSIVCKELRYIHICHLMSSEGEGGNHNVPREGNIPEIVAKAAHGALHFPKWCQRQRVSSFSCLSKNVLVDFCQRM